MAKARTELNNNFVDDLAKDWAAHGASVIEKVRVTRPELYVRAALELVPKKVEVSEGASAFDAMTPEQVEQVFIEMLAADLPAAARYMKQARELAAKGDVIVTLPDNDHPMTLASKARGRRPGLPFVQGR